MIRRTARLLAATGALWAVFGSSAFGADFYVDQETGSESDDCSTPALACQSIQRGVTFATNAGTNNTLRVDDSPAAYVTDNVTLFGGISVIADNTVAGTATESPTGKPIIQTANAAGQALFVQGPPGSAGTSIRGFTFRPNDHTAINVSGVMTAIQDNDFEGPASPVVTDDDQGIVLGATSPTVSGNTFTNLKFGLVGVGVGSPAITDNEFSGTHNGNAIEIQIGSPTLTGNIVHDPGAASAQAVRVGNSGPTVPVAVTFRRNRIEGSGLGVNIADTQGPISFDGDLIAGATIAGLSSSDSDNSGDGDVTATNVTIVSAPGASDEISLQGTPQLVLDSSALGDAGVTAPIGATCTISFSRGDVIAPGTNGCHNFQTTADPLFVSSGTGDFHLQQSSTLIDAGNPATPAAGVLDIDGQARVQEGDGACPIDPQRDIGADEFAGVVPTCAAPPPPSTTTPSTTTKKKCKKAKKGAAAAKKKCKKRKK
jgi:Right handed beta helix region